MTIASSAEAIAVRDRAGHKFHQVRNRTTDPGTAQLMDELAEDLLALDAWVVASLKPHDDIGVVVPFDGGGTPK